MPEQMQFTDTHTHIYTEEFDADRPQVVERAIDAGVTHMMLPNIDVASVAPMKALAATRPGVFSMAMGLHPSEVYANWREELDKIKAEFFSAPDLYHAVGEVGIDLYWDKTFEREQMLVFEEQIGWAEESGKPLIIHCRSALPQTLEVLEAHPGVPTVFHCFGGTADDAERILSQKDSYYFGVGGVVTFKKSRVPEALPVIGLSRILTETDSPYLAPVPHRGRRNESSYIPRIAAKIADTLGQPLAAVAEATVANAAKLFSLK